ncbi:MAG: superoxide dismutase [Candidatus Binatia bacterium]|nr:superoxide dismutase [Candidatus Binatia bacterium]
MAYEVQVGLRPRDLHGISEEQIAQHWKLYEGYVAQVNALRSELEGLRREGKGNTVQYADRRRRLGFEYNGMVLHEYYFGNLKADVDELRESSELYKLLVAQFGGFDQFRDDFVACGATRSIGWAILAFDPQVGTVNNHFVQIHEEGNVAGFVPLLVMDVWEHAYMVDYGATGRPQYMQAFWRNVNWPVVEKRFVDAVRGVIPRRC